jgi:hypothetical protein
VAAQPGPGQQALTGERAALQGNIKATHENYSYGAAVPGLKGKGQASQVRKSGHISDIAGRALASSAAS